MFVSVPTVTRLPSTNKAMFIRHCYTRSSCDFYEDSISQRITVFEEYHYKKYRFCLFCSSFDFLNFPL